MRIVAIVGMPGSGKSVLADYLRTHGLPIMRFGEIVINEVKRRGLPVTPDNERLVREELRRQHGMDVCATFALPRIRALLATHQTLVIDGLYSLSEYTTLRRAFAHGNPAGSVA